MNKSVVSHTIPDEDRAAFDAAVREGIEAADAGLLTPFEPVAEWLASWGTDHEVPAPKMKVRIPDPAKADLSNIRLYLQSQSPAAA